MTIDLFDKYAYVDSGQHRIPRIGKKTMNIMLCLPPTKSSTNLFQIQIHISLNISNGEEKKEHNIEFYCSKSTYSVYKSIGTNIIPTSRV